MSNGNETYSYGEKRVALTLTIPNSGTVSDSQKLDGYTPVAIYTPAALTSTALTFQASADDATFSTMRTEDGTAEVSITVTTSKFYPLDPKLFRGASYIKVVGDSTEGGERALTLIVLPEINNN